MTIIIHPVGNGDLGNDIVNLSHEERLTMQAERLRELQEIIDEAEPKDLAAALFDLPGGVAIRGQTACAHPQRPERGV